MIEHLRGRDRKLELHGWRQLRESDALRSPTPRQSSNLGIRFLVDAFARPQHLVAT